MKRGCLIILILILFITSGCAQTQVETPTLPSTPDVKQPTEIPEHTDITPTPTPAPPSDIVPPAVGKTIVVTSPADSGPGTLRQALMDARRRDTITFDPAVFPPSKPATIFLKAADHDSSLPNVNQGDLTIDASNAGVILDGSNILKDWVHGLEIYSDGNTVRGLQIVNFSGAGIVIGGSAQYNTIGGNRSIGSGPVGQGNLVSNGNVGIGLWDDATSFNTITGNSIGTDLAGANAWSNTGSGVYIADGASHNVIGPDNIIAYNNAYGVEIRDSSSIGNTITQNSIHGNVPAGIHLWYGGNTGMSAPFILEFDLANGTVTGTAGAYDTIEIFSDSSHEGEVYEGKTKTDGSGAFIFNKSAPFTGPHLTATATDTDGNTSVFSPPTSGIKGSTIRRPTIFQEGNDLPKTTLQPKESRELEDNRIGIHTHVLWYPEPGPFPGGILDTSNIIRQGFKRVRLAINTLDSYNAIWSKPENTIDPSHDDFITSLADNGITITYVLSFWDKEYVAQGGKVQSPRFKTEDEIQRYLDFVRFIVCHFKDRIEYYEIWNEPTITTTIFPDSIQWIEVEDYINLVKRAVPVIRQEYPEAKIVVGGTSSLIDTESQAYLFNILRSDIMPLVDIVSWHPMYGSSPEYDWHRQYYYEYPSIVQEIKDVASAHGFRGEYIADEIHWCTPDQPAGGWPTYSETKSVKYLTRCIVMHLGMDVSITQILLWGKPQLFRTNQNLCTVIAGAKPASLSVEIESEAENIKSYAFSLPNDDKLLALWTDGVAADDDPGVKATLTFPGLSAQKVVGIDVLHGFEQQMTANIEGGNTVITNLLVKDYPIILRFTP